MKPKIALVVDWLVTYAGAERVIKQILKCYPQADIFAVCDFLPENQRHFLQGKQVKTTFIQKLPMAKKRYRSYLPLMPLAMKQFDLSGYDVILSSSHAVAKGVRKAAHQLHISYVHSPMRYAWDFLDQYLEHGHLKGPKRWLAKRILLALRKWDYRVSQQVDSFIANSDYIAERIQRCYRKPAAVIYPPVEVDKFPLVKQKKSFFLAASRLVPYKRTDLIVKAFNQLPQEQLVIIGDGPELEYCRGLASENVTLLGRVDDAALIQNLGQAKALVFAAEEDFGILPVEAQACGTPVIAYGKGGALETITPTTGLFFEEQTESSILAAIQAFQMRAGQYQPDACRQNAERFAPAVFRRAYRKHVDSLLS